MRIVFDGSVCFDRFGACFHYYSELVPRLSRMGCHVTLTPSPTGALDSLREQGASVAKPVLPGGGWIPPGKTRKALSKVKQGLETYFLRRRLEREQELTLFQSFFYTLPPSPKFLLVGMILDVIPEKFPDWYATENDRALLARRRAYAERAQRFLAISECTKRDFSEAYNIPPSRIDVVPLGINLEAYLPRPAADLEVVRRQHGLDRPFFLQVGGRQKHKNFPLLARAFAQSAVAKEFDLVCVGERWEPEEVVLLAELGLSQRVKLLRRPEEETLRCLYQCASALAYPSLYEGFGLPPLEAMASGLPVAASRGGSIPEVVGSAARLFDPTSTEDATRALEAVVQPQTASALRAAGLARAAEFSWDRVAEQTWGVYRKLVSTPARSSGQAAFLESPR
ncbi:glycosyltransferase family 4 protein [bacterium]|nr:glycosyltransferase family 4 protein [bacterium]